MEKFIPFIGLTYKPSAREHDVVDCWGLIVRVYKDLYNIDVPKFTECSYAKDGAEGTVDFLFSTTLYRECQKIDINEAQEGDLMLLTNAGQATHIAIYIDKEHMLHCFDRAGSVIESHRSTRWKNRILAVYRHPAFL